MTLHVERHGPPDAPTVLLLHGGGTAGWSWQDQLPALRRAGYRVLVPDLPGHGQSPGPFHMEDAAAQVARLLREEGGSARVVGFSLGAQLGLQLLADHPELFVSALLTGTLAAPMPGGGVMLSGPLRTLLAWYWPQRTARLPLWLNRLTLELPARLGPQLAEDARRMSLDGHLQMTRANLTFRPPGQLAHLQVPVLVLAGARELPIIRRSARQLERLLPHGQARLVPGMLHTWPLSHPQRFNRILLTWLQRGRVASGLRPVN
ncbi:alpha/beta hydrolase [Deinococcus sonorensis]|uniref:Alpha/beta hydrolase n=2 Tax=Deinococcus sonorensis TaxID=309891 RepID=A0AAU7U7U4_9DEIO